MNLKIHIQYFEVDFGSRFNYFPSHSLKITRKVAAREILKCGCVCACRVGGGVGGAAVVEL